MSDNKLYEEIGRQHTQIKQLYEALNKRIEDLRDATDYVAKAAELRDRVTELESELAKVSAERDMLRSLAEGATYSVRERDEWCATQRKSIEELQLENAELKARICEDFLQMCRMSE